jgi:multiple sugar transport system permease protein
MRTRTILVAIIAGLFFLGVAPVFAGGGQDDSGGVVTVEFVNWVTAEESTRTPVDDIIDDFESKNPDINVNPVPVGFSDILNQLTVMYNSGDSPDLAQAAGPNITILALMDALASADKVFPRDFQNDLVKSAYDLTTVDGTHYGIPWAPGPDGLFYNKDLLAQAGMDPNNPPETIYDFQDQIAKARGPLPSEIVVFGFEMTYPFLRAFGATPFQGVEKANFNTPEIKEYMQWMRTSVENKYTLPGKKIGEFRPIAAQGRLVFMIDPSFVKGIVLSINDQLTEEQFNKSWGVAALPGDKNGKHYTVSIFFMNSVINSIGTVLLAIVLAVLAAYALSRVKFRFRKAVSVGILTTQMFPLVVLLIPLYLLYKNPRLLNTYQGLILAFTSFTLPFSIWMLKGFIDSVPIEVEESAFMDGCTRLQILTRILLPLIIPGVVATGVFAFLDAWNNLLFPLMLVSKPSMKTLPPGMILAFAGEFKHDWGGMMATSVIVSLPVVVAFVLVQRFLVEGLTRGAIKG